jgi:hypothetical protein
MQLLPFSFNIHTGCSTCYYRVQCMWRQYVQSTIITSKTSSRKSVCWFLKVRGQLAWYFSLLEFLLSFKRTHLIHVTQPFHMRLIIRQNIRILMSFRHFTAQIHFRTRIPLVPPPFPLLNLFEQAGVSVSVQGTRELNPGCWPAQIYCSVLPS